MIGFQTAPTLALAAAALFGLSTLAAKVLVGAVDPWLLAGLLYLGSGVGLTLFRWSRQRLFRRASVESPVMGRDLFWPGGAILFRGVIGPVLLTYGSLRGWRSNLHRSCPTLGLPNKIPVRGRVICPIFAAAAAWSTSVNSIQPFSVTVLSKR